LLEQSPEQSHDPPHVEGIFAPFVPIEPVLLKQYEKLVTLVHILSSHNFGAVPVKYEQFAKVELKSVILVQLLNKFDEIVVIFVPKKHERTVFNNVLLINKFSGIDVIGVP
jgi:hypothetical protein